MNRILLKECLDKLRSDDLEELTEAHNHRSKHKKHPGRKRRQTQKKVGAGPNYAHRHSGSSKPTSRNQSNRKPTTGIDSKTGQELASLAETIAQEGAKSPEDFLNELSTRCGRPMAVADNSKYFTNTNTGVNLRLRLANHRGSAEWFFVNGHPRNNFGIVIKTEPKRFVPDKRVQYREEIFFKDDLDAEMEIGIVKGLMNWVATGRYNGPLGNETATSPDGRVVLNRRPRNRLASNPQQPTTPPLSPPTGPGVLESLAAKYFKEAHNMKYRLLIEAALEELIHEDWMGYSPEERRRLNRWQRSDIRDAEPYIPQAMIRGKTRRKSDSGEYTGPIIPAGQEFMERRRADALDPLFSQCLRYLRAMDKTSGEYQEMKDLMKQGRYREALRRFSQYDEFHFTPEYDEEERKRAKGEYGEYPDFGHADLNNPDVDAAFRDGQI